MVIGIEAGMTELSRMGFNVVTVFFLTLFVVTVESWKSPEWRRPTPGR